MSEGRIVVLCPNPALEVTYFCDAFVPHRQNSADYRLAAGGKGLNVANVLKRIGSDPLLLGCLDLESGGIIQSLFLTSHVRSKFVEHNCGIRVSVVVYDKAEREPTVIRSDGACLSSDLQREYLSLVDQHVLPNSIVCVCGSVPRGFSSQLMTDICDLCTRRRAVALVDVSTPLLEAALNGSPFVVKVNLKEITSLFRGVDNYRDLLFAAASRGAQNVIVTLGRDGWVAKIGERYLRGRMEPNPNGFDVGAGDAMMAGLANALDRGLPLVESLQFATKVAAASTYCGTSGDIVLDKVHLPDVVELYPL